jgi:hypothetical protein
MLGAAHASCFHWLHVGTPLNHQRAECLLATACLRAGLREAALQHAERCLALSREATEVQSPFDLATAYGCAASAYAALGQADRAKELHAKAQEQVSRFDHPEDVPLFEKLYPAPA